MAHDHYKAVCDKCGEACEVMVNDPKRTFHMLGDDDSSNKIKAWLLKHYGCNLRLIHRDDQMDELWDAGFECLSQSGSPRMYKVAK